MLSIATWNVQRLEPKHRRAVRDELPHVRADVLVLTESSSDFQPSEGFHLASQSADARDRGGLERWVCIWTHERLDVQPLSLSMEPERSAAVLVRHPGIGPLVVFGTVLPWRSDSRQADVRGGAAFQRSLDNQADDISNLLAECVGAQLVFAGDWNQEVSANGPVGTARGRAALSGFLDKFDLQVPTAEDGDPLHRAGWRRSIDHIAVSTLLAPRIVAIESWPTHYPLGHDWPDHHGVGITIGEAGEDGGSNR